MHPSTSLCLEHKHWREVWGHLFFTVSCLMHCPVLVRVSKGERRCCPSPSWRMLWICCVLSVANGFLLAGEAVAETAGRMHLTDSAGLAKVFWTPQVRAESASGDFKCRPLPSPCRVSVLGGGRGGKEANCSILFPPPNPAAVCLHFLPSFPSAGVCAVCVFLGRVHANCAIVSASLILPRPGDH